MKPRSQFLDAIRDADWLDARRARAYTYILLGMCALGAIVWIALSHGLIDRGGKPLGPDFMSFYSASKLALAGEAANAWRPEAHQAAQTTIFGRGFVYWAFFYPPPYLLVCWPLALLPYGAALLIWSVTTAGAFLGLMRLWLRKLNAGAVIGWPVLLAMPALWLNLGYGQNGALTAAIMVGGCLLLDRRPFMSGAILGLLVIKPQLAIVLPFVLGATGRWKAFCTMGASAAILLTVSWLAVGGEGFSAFLDNSRLARATLDQGLVDPAAMQSLFGALYLFGAPVTFLYIIQGLFAVGVIVVASWTGWKDRPDAFGAAALMAAATPLLSPFMLAYDLMLTAIPLAWLIVQGGRTGFLPWEKTVCLLAFILPFASRPLATHLHLPVAPLVLTGLLILVIRRLVTQSAATERSAS